MRVLIAPDKFRGTLSAAEAARAVATGWRRTRPQDELTLAPMADGGEGTLETLVGALGGRTHRAEVHGPLGAPVRAAYGLIDGPAGPVGVVEMARASGLTLLPEGGGDPRRTTTWGTGELIALALEHEPARVLVCLGGSATNDGGVGMAQALGGRFLDAAGRQLPPGGIALLDLVRIDLRSLAERVGGTVRFVAASDVDDPLCGPSGASAVYGPQKGASSEDVRLLDRALGHLAAVVLRDLGIDLKDEPGAGAAGGLGFGLMAFLGARLRPGVEVVMDAIGLPGCVMAADLVLTGEGKLDAQSLSGKVVAGVLRVAAEAGVRAAVVCGRAEIALIDVRVASLVDRFGPGPALEDARRCLETLAQEMASELGGPS